MMFITRLRADASFHRCDFSIRHAKPHIIHPTGLQKRLSGMNKLLFGGCGRHSNKLLTSPNFRADLSTDRKWMHFFSWRFR
jgi:hypothetical protein